MAIKVLNTLVGEEQEFVPVHEGRVGIYVCGPTVYADAHVGHGKTYVNFDVVVRYLRYKGFQVRHVENITDVGHILDSGEDRILMGAAREQVQPMELVERYTRRFFEDMDMLNVARPDISPRASGHIPEQVELVKTLIEKGYAYEVDGNVYFEVHKFQGYGKLSGRKLDELESGTRVEVEEDKRDPADFALWKKASPEHIMRWNSPWGWGYPGWHVECSAMSTKYLGQPFDIHGGGMENKFPHHEDEIAQSEAAAGKPFCKYWLHNGMLMIRGEEMHKSLGNFVTLRQAYEQYHPMTLRLFILTAHYRSPLDLTEEAITAAEKGRQRLWGAVSALRARLSDAPEGELSDQVSELIDGVRQRFEAAMDNDFSTPGALGALYDLTREVNGLLNSDQSPSKQDLEALDGAYRTLGGEVLGIIPDEMEDEGLADLSEGLVALLIETRSSLREAKQWAMADGIRDKLAEMGIELKDGPEGTTWQIAG